LTFSQGVLTIHSSIKHRCNKIYGAKSSRIHYHKSLLEMLCLPTCFNNLLNEELVQINHFTNLLVEEDTRGLTIDNLTERKTNCNLSNQELDEIGTNNLLKKHPVGKY
jgi:hypothetical protein